MGEFEKRQTSKQMMSVNGLWREHTTKNLIDEEEKEEENPAYIYL